MAEPKERITIHTKKFYRVILEGIDTDTETPDSFAVKLSVKVHVPLARAQLVARCLPYTAKSGLNTEQANRLKTLLEEIGGKTRVEPYFVTPQDPVAADGPAGERAGGGKTPVLCPECGAEQPSGAAYCSFCLRKFRNGSSRPATLEELLPNENPLETGGAEKGIDWLAAVRFVRRRPIAVLVGVIVVLVAIALIK
jgi:hypothetical protein